MKIFICWSGDLAQELGDSLRKWFPMMIQAAKTYFTPSDIEKGARWNTEIAVELDKTDIGILCLTRENLSSEWILFEAGALSKKLDISCVCPILFDLEKSELHGPLSQFQATSFNHDDMYKLLCTINGLCGDSKLSEETLKEVFSIYWPKMEEEIASILKRDKKRPAKTHRGEREILDEVLALTRETFRRTTVDRISAESIHPRAIDDLVLSYRELEKCAKELGNDDIMKIVSQLGRPVGYITSRYSKSIRYRSAKELPDQITFEDVEP